MKSRNKKNSVVLTLNRVELAILILILLLIGTLVFTVVTFSRKVNVQTIKKSVDTVQNLIKSIDKTTIQSIKSDIDSISTVIKGIQKQLQPSDINDLKDTVSKVEGIVSKVEGILDSFCTNGYTLEAGSLHSSLPEIPSKPLTIKIPCGKNKK